MTGESIPILPIRDPRYTSQVQFVQLKKNTNTLLRLHSCPPSHRALPSQSGIIPLSKMIRKHHQNEQPQEVPVREGRTGSRYRFRADDSSGAWQVAGVSMSETPR